MRALRLPAALVALTAALLGLVAAAPAAETLAPPLTPDRLPCVAPTDAAGIARGLASVGSPLTDDADAFVADAEEVGLDPRALVAIAAHETLLETYPPAQLIRNPFGLGPGWTFDSERDAIATAARTLQSGYLAEGRVTLADIGPKWAPVGVGNDPAGLNAAWPSGVSAYYSALGGDPTRPVLLADQNPSPACAAAPGGAGPSVVMAWGGGLPDTGGPRMDQGGDPATGLPATIPGFVFPLAAPDGATIGYHDAFTDPGAPGCYGRPWRCDVPITSAPGVTVVAAAAGILRAAGPAGARSGIAFWIDRLGGERLGYSGLGAYAAGVADGVGVRAGQPLGTSTGTLTFAWVRRGLLVNPYFLLRATRPSDL
jgi:hypothetical protein